MSTYSAKLFSEYAEKICVDDDFLPKAEENDFCFVECGDIMPFIDRVNTFVLFKWNRHYPANVYFPVDLNNGEWKLCSTENFAGNSHSKVTMEVYTR